MDQNFLSQLPPEYQAEVQKLLRKQQMAQAMQKQALSLGAGPTQFSGGYAVKNSPFLPIIQALSGHLAGKEMTAADTGIADVSKRYETSTAEEMGRLSQAQDPSVISSFRASTNPRVRQLAEAITKQRLELAGKGADVLKDSNPAAALDTLRTGNIPGQYTPPALKQPEVRWIDDPNNPGKKIAQTLNYDKFGLGKATLGTQGNTVSVDARQAGKEGEMALDATKADLKDWNARAEAAKQTLFASRGALEAINEGAKSGGLEGFKLSAKKVLQGFGVATDNLNTTEELSMALGTQVLAKARALAPVTQADVEQLKSILGSVNTDPQALQKMLAITNGIAMKELQDYNRYVDHQSGSLTNPMAKDLFSGAGIGREMLPPPGDTGQGLRAIQEMAKRGGNPSSFAIGGKPIEEGAQFDIRGPQVTPNGPVISFDDYLKKLKKGK